MEYFIRLMDDRPPDVRIVRPAGDQQVSPLEEVAIEAHAEDDYGIDRFELVYAVRGGAEKSVPLGGGGPATSRTGSHLLYVEDLSVEPGDFVTYYARARDIGRGKRSTEARSDIFFLEVKPFEEEFVSAQSQAMAGGSGNRSVEGLVAAQKEIIIATWKLDRRSTGGRSAQDVRAIGRAQGDLKARAQAAAGHLRRAAARPRPPAGPPVPETDPMSQAIDAMARAQTSLEAVQVPAAIPHEMEALNQLLKAQAEIRRRQVSQQRASAGGGGGSRSTQDLSALFDRELQRQQQTNYETRSQTEEREEESASDAASKVKELARRQDDLARQQRELARANLSPEEVKRQLERLTREQTELRQRAEELARQLARQNRDGRQTSPGQQSQQQDGSQPSRGSAQGQAHGQQASGEPQAGQPGPQSPRTLSEERRMRDISEEMRSAASDLRRQDLSSAGDRGGRAAEKLRELERQLRGNTPEGRQRALGELQLEARQLADEQRRIAAAAGRLNGQQADADARRRIAGDKERLADRVAGMERTARQLAAGTQGQDRTALAEAVRELDRQQLARRMREGAAQIRERGAPQGEADRGANRPQSGPPQRGGERQADGTPRQGGYAESEQQLARALDRVADRMGGAAGTTADAEARKLSEQLARARDARDRLEAVERELDRLGRERQAPESSPGQAAGTPQASPGAATQGALPSQQGAQPGQQGDDASGGGGRGGGLQRLQQEYSRQLREAQELLDQLRRDNPTLGRNLTTPERHEFSLSAPGTEAFKQDFAKWEALRKNIGLALEQYESSILRKLAEKAAEDRLTAGASDGLPDAYRELVARYYEALAKRKKRN
ncbi:MAG: hypothetical protein LC804_12655 [Acidobacteria bacterium]|nr:hypothetical protein [Acidobacteriota bacterium]